MSGFTAAGPTGRDSQQPVMGVGFWMAFKYLDSICIYVKREIRFENPGKTVYPLNCGSRWAVMDVNFDVDEVASNGGFCTEPRCRATTCRAEF